MSTLSAQTWRAAASTRIHADPHTAQLVSNASNIFVRSKPLQRYAIGACQDQPCAATSDAVEPPPRRRTMRCIHHTITGQRNDETATPTPIHVSTLEVRRVTPVERVSVRRRKCVNEATRVTNAPAVRCPEPSPVVVVSKLRIPRMEGTGPFGAFHTYQLHLSTMAHRLRAPTHAYLQPLRARAPINEPS